MFYVCGFLFHQPAVVGLAERVAEFADKGTFTHVRHPRQFGDAFRMAVRTQHECLEIILGTDYIAEETSQSGISVEVAHHQKKLVFLDYMVTG